MVHSWWISRKWYRDGTKRDRPAHHPHNDCRINISPFHTHACSDICGSACDSVCSRPPCGHAYLLLSSSGTTIPHLPPPRAHNVGHHKHRACCGIGILHCRMACRHLHVRLSPSICIPCRLQMRTNDPPLPQRRGMRGQSGRADLVGIAAPMSSQALRYAARSAQPDTARCRKGLCLLQRGVRYRRGGICAAAQ